MSDISPRPVARLIPRDHTPVRVAVAGLGSMGEIHMKAAAFLQAGISEDYYKADLPQQIKRLKICAVCDRDQSKQSDFPSYPFYTDWDELLRKEIPQIAVIASPTRSHFALAMKALEAGVHTLVEKPITETPEECQTLLKTAEQNGCRVLAGHVERYNPVAIKLHSMIFEDNLKIRSYRFERSQPLPQRIPDDIITDKLIHDLDLAIYLFGSVEESRTLSSRVVDNRVMEIEEKLAHNSGTVGRLFVSWLVEEKDSKRRQVEIKTSRGELISGDFVRKYLSIAGVEVPCGVQGWITPINNQIKDQLADFLAYCLEPVPGIPPPLLSSEEILESTQLIENIRNRNQHV